MPFRQSFPAPMGNQGKQSTGLVTTLWKGGLGNMLFELAAAFGTAADAGPGFVCALSSSYSGEPNGGHSRVDYCKSIFANFESEQAHRPANVRPCQTHVEDPFRTCTFDPISVAPGRPLQAAASQKDLFDCCFCFQKADGSCISGCKWLCLDGYFQSHKYLGKHRDDFVKKLVLPKVDAQPHTMFVHVRRGDANFGLHQYLDDRAYYSRALLRAKQEHSEKLQSLLICSDDIEWCRTVLPEAIGAIVGGEVQVRFLDADEMVTMATMAACELGGICANSSFSWWAAFIGHAPGKLSILPDPFLHVLEFDGRACTDFKIDLYFDGCVKVSLRGHEGDPVLWNHFSASDFAGVTKLPQRIQRVDELSCSSVMASWEKTVRQWDETHWPKSSQMHDIGPHTALKFEFALDEHALSHSLVQTQQQFPRLTAFIAHEKVPFNYASQMKTKKDLSDAYTWVLPSEDEVQSMPLHVLNVTPEQLEHAIQWDKAVRHVCPAGSGEAAWVTLPGCSSSPAAMKSGRPPQYYYLLKSDENPEHGCVLYVVWHRVLSDLGGLQHFLQTWSQNYQTCCNLRTSSHEQLIYADGQSCASSDPYVGELDAWFCGRYRVVAHQNLPPSSTGAVPSTPADSVIMVTSSEVIWKNRMAGSKPFSFRHDMTLNSPGFTVGAGGESVRFEFQGQSGDLVAHFSFQSQTISVAYKKDPSVKMKVFRRIGANLNSLEASGQAHFGDESSVRANDILMAKYCIAVGRIKRERLIDCGCMKDQARLASISLLIDNLGQDLTKGYIGNLQRPLRLHVAWDMLLSGDVNAVAQLFRAQISLATRPVIQTLQEKRDLLETYLRLQLTDNEFLGILIAEGHLGHPSLANWMDSTAETKAMFEGVSFGTATGAKEVIPFFFRRRNKEEHWPSAYDDVRVFYRRSNELAISIFAQDEEWTALEACFGTGEDWGVFD